MKKHTQQLALFLKPRPFELFKLKRTTAYFALCEDNPIDRGLALSTMSGECEVERSASAGSEKQSLFNIYYLGKTKVDRRCNSSMMPWIIEELKLKADEMRFIWLSPGWL